MEEKKKKLIFPDVVHVSFHLVYLRSLGWSPTELFYLFIFSCHLYENVVLTVTQGHEHTRTHTETLDLQNVKHKSQENGQGWDGHWTLHVRVWGSCPEEVPTLTPNHPVWREDTVLPCKTSNLILLGHICQIHTHRWGSIIAHIFAQCDLWVYLVLTPPGLLGKYISRFVQTNVCLC